MEVLGSASATKNLGKHQLSHCAHCQQERQFNLHLQYHYAHLWHAIKWVKRAEYQSLCEVCQLGAPIEQQIAQTTLGKHPIPFVTRYGIGVLFGLLASSSLLWLTVEKVSSNNALVRDRAYIATPLPNDVYAVDLAKIMNTPASSTDAEYKYGMLKLQSASADKMHFFISNQSFNRMNGVKQDLSSGKYKENFYFSNVVLTISKAEILMLRETGSINSIVR